MKLHSILALMAVLAVAVTAFGQCPTCNVQSAPMQQMSYQQPMSYGSSGGAMMSYGSSGGQPMAYQQPMTYQQSPQQQVVVRYQPQPQVAYYYYRRPPVAAYGGVPVRYTAHRYYAW